MIINLCHCGLGGAPHWRMVASDGLRDLTNPHPPPLTRHPYPWVFQSIPAHVKDGDSRRVMKPFRTVPTL